MTKKKLYNSGGIVYSTAGNFDSSNQEESQDFMPPNAQLLKVVLDKKHRAGKVVSIIKGFSMKSDDIESIGKKLKAFCGSGGSVKDDQIVIQGDHRDKILQWLLKNNFTKSMKI